MDIPYVNVHTHSTVRQDNSLEIINRFPWQLTEESGNEYFSVGIHPWYIRKENLTHDLAILEQYIRHEKCMAIGETGLDRITGVPLNIQIEAFEKQLTIAEQANLPVIIHCVKAYSEIISIRKKRKTNVPWIIHGFNENETIAEKLIALGCSLSFGDILTKHHSKAAKLFPIIESAHVFLETDDKENLRIEEVYAQAAKLKNMELKILKETIFNNFSKHFNRYSK